jgi:hypothetical protein
MFVVSLLYRRLWQNYASFFSLSRLLNVFSKTFLKQLYTKIPFKIRIVTPADAVRVEGDEIQVTATEDDRTNRTN